MVGIGAGCCCDPCENPEQPEVECYRQVGDGSHRLYYIIRKAKSATITFVCTLVETPDPIEVVLTDGQATGLVDIPHPTCTACLTAVNCNYEASCCSEPPGPPPDDCCAYLRPDYVFVGYPDAAGGGSSYACCDIMDGQYIMPENDPPPPGSGGCVFVTERHPVGEPDTSLGAPSTWWNNALTDAEIIAGGECYIEEELPFFSPGESGTTFIKWYVVYSAVIVSISNASGMLPSAISVTIRRYMLRTVHTVYTTPPGTPSVVNSREIYADEYTITGDCEAFAGDADDRNSVLISYGSGLSLTPPLPPNIPEFCSTDTWFPYIQLVTVER